MVDMARSTGANVMIVDDTAHWHNRRGLKVCKCVCVSLGSGFGVSQIPSVLFVTAQRAGAAMSGPHQGRRGVASAPQFVLYVRCGVPCCARGGCCALVSVSGASMLQISSSTLPNYCVSL